MFSVRKILDHIAAIGVLVLILSLVHVFIYYFEFGVNVLPFISVSEVPKYSIGIFLPVVYCSAVMALQMISMKKQADASRIADGIRVSPEESSLSKSLSRFAYISQSLVMKMLVSIFIFPIMKINIMSYICMGIAGASLLFDFALISFYLNESDFENCKKEKHDLKDLIYMNLLVTAFISTVAISRLEAGSAISRPSQKISFIHSGNEIETNDTICYIGNTESFVFLYNINNRITSFYPMDKVEDFKSQDIRLKRDREKLETENRIPKKDTCFYSVKVPENIDMPATPHFDTLIVRKNDCSINALRLGSWGTETSYTLTPRDSTIRKKVNSRTTHFSSHQFGLIDITDLPAGQYSVNLRACGNGGTFTLRLQ